MRGLFSQQYAQQQAAKLAQRLVDGPQGGCVLLSDPIKPRLPNRSRISQTIGVRRGSTFPLCQTFSHRRYAITGMIRLDPTDISSSDLRRLI
jgi:hypothetical protein